MAFLRRVWHTSHGKRYYWWAVYKSVRVKGKKYPKSVFVQYLGRGIKKTTARRKASPIIAKLRKKKRG